MGVILGLRGSQTQALAMNAQVIQSIKLLQFDQQELQAFVDEQVERNPLIEVAEEASPAANGKERQIDRAAAAGSERPSAEAPMTGGAAEGGGGRTGTFERGDGDFVGNTLAASVTLREHLSRQIQLSVRDAAARQVAVEIIESLDDDGYLRVDLGAVADRLGIDDAAAEAALTAVQALEPSGVGARSLAECLRLQLADRGRLTAAFGLLLDNLAALAQHDYRRLSAVCGVAVEEVVAMAALLRSLDPKPGRRFDADPVLPAIPDVSVELRPDGSFVARLCPAALPRVLINRDYYSEVRASCARGSDARFVADCYKSANWLVRSLERRAGTILKVATAIIARQRDFLLRGPEFLKPLNLKDIADEVGVHQSTVSRTISNKFMLTNRGLVEFKFFFTNAVPLASGDEERSADMVRHMIKRIVAGETAETVLSDDAIVHRLRDSGVEIARRTVAKYRESLKIPPSLQRRRQRETEDLTRARPLPEAMTYMTRAAA